MKGAKKGAIYSVKLRATARNSGTLEGILSVEIKRQSRGVTRGD